MVLKGYGIEDGAFGGIFDGHGPNGHIVSKMVRNRLPALLLSQRNAIAKIITSSPSSADQSTKNLLKWKDACITAFKVVDKEIKLLDNVDCSSSGTTAAVVIKQAKS